MTKISSLRVYGMLSIATIILLVSCYLLFVSIIHGLLEQELESWRERNIASASYTRWENQQPLVAFLVTLSPYSGLILQNSSRFYQLGAEIAAASPATDYLATDHHRQALQLIRKSLLKQPAWPLAWMDLSNIKASLGLFDNEFQKAFSMALMTGSAEHDILLGMTELGFFSWRNLTPDNRNRFLALLNRAVLKERQHVIQTAEHYHRDYILCFLLSDKHVMAHYCKSR